MLDYAAAEFADQKTGVGKAIAVTGISAGGVDAGNDNVTTITALERCRAAS